jgi:anaerobic selenocysteine-containing dehydrogenase
MSAVASYEDAEHADLTVLWGSNARETHPIFFHHVLQGLRNGASALQADPRAGARLRQGRPRPAVLDAGHHRAPLNGSPPSDQSATHGHLCIKGRFGFQHVQNLPPSP